MSVLAVDLCDGVKVPFAAAFSQQFLLSPSADLSLPGFTVTPFADRHLYVGKTLPKAEVKGTGRAKRHIVVLGRAVDAEGHLVTDERLSTILADTKDMPAMERYIEALGGRYVVLVQWAKSTRVYLDPAGTMGALVNRENGFLGSTLFLVLTREVIPTDAYPAELQASRFAFGHTADRDVFALMPNHFHDLETGVNTRFWPKDQSFDCKTVEELDAGIDAMVQRHGQIMRALAGADGPLILAMSGGQDSRILLTIAVAEGVKPDLLFSHVTNQNTQIDADIGGELCDLVGWEMERIDSFSENRNATLPKWQTFEHMRAAALGRGNAQYHYDAPSPKHRVLGREMIVSRALPPGGCLLRGHVTDISKAVLWRRIGINAYRRNGAAGLNNDIAARLLYHDRPEFSASPFVQENFARWRDALPEGAHGRTLDFMGLELYRNYSLGNSFYTLNHNFYMAPGCDRLIIEHLASAPPLLRSLLQYNHRIIARTTPALNAVPYTRAPDNDLIAKSPRLDDDPAFYGLV